MAGRRYIVKELSYLPETPGELPRLIQPGTEIIFDGKPGANLQLVEEKKKGASAS